MKNPKAKQSDKNESDILLGREHITGYDGWPPPKHIQDHLEIFAKFVHHNTGGKTILDIGCGDGAIDRIIAQISPKRKIVGLDVEAHEHWGIKTPKNLSFTEASLYDIPFNEKSFDVVIMKDVLHHLEDPAEVVAKIAKLAKKQVLIIEANRYNPVSFIRMVKIAGHEHFSQRKIKRIIDKPHKIHTIETHVWPSSIRKIGDASDKLSNKLPLLSNLRNYNLVIFEP